MPDVSVIIPVYNREIAGASVASALGQREVDFEVIVVDDGSTDCRAPQLRETYDGRSEFRMIRIEHRGPAGARNAGVAIASAPLIAFLDSDDIWAPEKLARQLAFAREHPEYRISQAQEHWIDDGAHRNPGRRHLKRGGDIFVDSLRTCLISPSTVIMEKSLFDEAGGFDEDLAAAEDYDLWLRILIDHEVGLLDEILATRLGHADQLSRTIQAIDRYRMLALMKLLQSERLIGDRRAAAIEVLIEKIAIYAKGLRRRGRIDEAEFHERVSRNAQSRWHIAPDCSLNESITTMRNYVRIPVA
jgi:glycosyltransferase involved in cell wall biosynthesis